MAAAGQIDDPHVVRAHDAGEVDGTHYLVMEFVDGLDLQQLQERIGPLSVPNACEIIRQAALGLQSASNAGLVHRDIKPSNLMLTHSGAVKVLDLGLAQMTAETDSDQKPGLTTTGQIMGTFDYLAPEQATDTKNVDIRADIYSLGCTLFKLLTGHAPYTLDQPATAYQRIRAHLENPIPSATAARSDVPVELDAVLFHGLEKEAAKRIQTPNELATQLATFCDGHDLPAIVASATDTTSAEVDTAEVGGETMQYTAIVSPPPAEVADANTTHSEAVVKPQLDSPIADEVQTVLEPPVAGFGRRRILPTAIVLTLAAGLIAYFSGLLTFTVKTDGGTIVLECDPAALQGAQIEVDGQAVEITLAGDNQPITIGVDKRRGQLRITKAGFKVFDRDLDIALGDNEHAIKVRLDPLEPVAMSSTTDPHRSLAEWVLSVGGSADLYHDGPPIRLVRSTRDLPETQFTVGEIVFTDVSTIHDGHMAKLRKLCEQSGKIDALHLSGTAVTDTGLSQLEGLTVGQVHLSDTQVSDACIEHLQKINRLGALTLSATQISNIGVARISVMPGIVSLGLSSTSIDNQALHHLHDLPNLQMLSISDTDITDEGLEHLSVHRKLTTLLLTGNQIGDAGVKHLASLSSLRRLELNHAKVTDAGVTSLANLKQLIILALADTRITDESLKLVADSFPQIESLSVGQCEIHGEGLRGIGNLTNLKRLLMDQTKVTDAGLAHLTRLDTLDALILQGSPITDEGLKHLTGLKQLRTLDLQRTKVTAAGVAELQKTLPECSIIWNGGIVDR